LDLIVVRGEGATGRVRQRPAQEPVVRVLDDKQTPVVGAAILFTLPTEGATGVFANGEKSVIVLTDSQGAAAAQGLRFNHVPGKVQIHVGVSYRGLTTRAIITQFSEAPEGYKAKSGGTGKVIAILAALAAGSAGGAVYALRKESSPPAPPTASGPAPIGITPGTPTLAPPR
jgi:hypothetical protein